MTDFRAGKSTLTIVFIILSVLLTAVAASAEPKIPVAQDKGEELMPHQLDTMQAEKKPFSFLTNPTTSTSETKVATKESMTSMDALSVSLGLIFVLLLIFSLAWFMRKMGYSNLSNQGQLKIITALNLGQKEKIALIQVGKQQLLVGITATQINTLHVLDVPLETTETQIEGRVQSPFANKLNEFLNSTARKNTHKNVKNLSPDTDK